MRHVPADGPVAEREVRAVRRQDVYPVREEVASEGLRAGDGFSDGEGVQAVDC